MTTAITKEDQLSNLAPNISNYTVFRSYTGINTVVNITSTGLSGTFLYDSSDASTADNGGTVIVDALNRRWKRQFSGDVYADWFGTVADGVTDDSTPIQAACNYLGSTIPYGGIVRLAAKKTYAIGTSIKLSRGVSVRGFSKDSTVLQLLGNNAGFEQIIVNGAGALNCGVQDLQIKGTGNAALTGQYGIVGSSSLQYSTFERILITNTGGNALHLPGTGLGAIYNSFRDIEITLCQGYGIYISGGTAQTRFERVRSINGYSHGIVFEGFTSQLIPFNNVFDTCGCELTNNTTSDVYGVWFKSSTVFNAYSTTFINCYMEPDSQIAAGNSACYRISAASGVVITGGIISQSHWGVLADGIYSQGIEVFGVFFNNSPSWSGNGNLSGTAMVAATASGASIHVGAQCTAQVTGVGVTWNTFSATNGGGVYGYLGFQTTGQGASSLTVLAPTGTTAQKPAAVAALRGQFYYTQQPTGQGVSDLLEVCVKKSDDTYAWRSVGGIQNASGTFSFGGTTVAAGATVTLTVGANGASTGRVVNVGPSVSLAGLIMTVNGETGSVIRLTFYNPTASQIVLASGTWLYEVIGV